MDLGGGLDIKVSKHFSIRLIQVDYMPTYNQYDATLGYVQEYFNEPEHTRTDIWERYETFKTDSGRLNNFKMSFGVLIGI